MKYIKKQDLERLAKRLEEKTVSRSKAGRSVLGKEFPDKKDGTKSTLTDTGRLLSSITSKVSEKLVIEVSTDVEYAEYVEEDRPFLGIGDDEEKIIEEEISDILENMLKKWARD